MFEGNRFNVVLKHIHIMTVVVQQNQTFVF